MYNQPTLYKLEVVKLNNIKTIRKKQLVKIKINKKQIKILKIKIFNKKGRQNISYYLIIQSKVTKTLHTYKKNMTKILQSAIN